MATPSPLTDDELDAALDDAREGSRSTWDGLTEEKLAAFLTSFDPVAFDAEYRQRERTYRMWVDARIAESKVRNGVASDRTVPDDLETLLAEADALLAVMEQ